MEVLVDGSRASSEYWLESQTMPAANVPPVSPEEHSVAEALSLTDEQYGRSKYAIEKTRAQLERRAFRFGEMVKSVLDENQMTEEVRLVWLSTFRGEYRVDLRKGGAEVRFMVPEDDADALLNSDTRAAQARLQALLSIHLVMQPAA